MSKSNQFWCGMADDRRFHGYLAICVAFYAGQDSMPTRSGAGEHSSGAASMRERAQAVGSTCRIESAPGQGTGVIVNCPGGGAPFAVGRFEGGTEFRQLFTSSRLAAVHHDHRAGHVAAAQQHKAVQVLEPSGAAECA
jgi:hypothetical protein